MAAQLCRRENHIKELGALKVIQSLFAVFDPVRASHAVNEELFHRFERKSPPLVLLQLQSVGLQLFLAYKDEMIAAERAVIHHFEGAFATSLHTAAYLYYRRFPHFLRLQRFFKLDAMDRAIENESRI
jgi:hypothetical protein